MDPLPPPPPPSREVAEPAELALRHMTRRAMAIGGGSVLAALGAGAWLVRRPLDDGLPWPLRGVLDLNGKIAQAVFRADRLAPTFATSRARWPRPNGDFGLGTPVDLGAWRLTVSSPSAPVSPAFTLEQIRALPRVEMTTELKCIEGWSTVVRWAGARLSDLAAKSRMATRSGETPDPANRPNDLLAFAALATPDREYYVGLDMASALHPQTLLAYEMNGEALAPIHGAPLRLVIPVKYGIKHIKRIGTITFSDARPTDFWAERGYDWYSGH